MNVDHLERRVRDCKNFVWWPGMAYYDEKDKQHRVDDDFFKEYKNKKPEFVPYLLDAATLGCLREVVCDTWAGEEINVVVQHSKQKDNVWFAAVSWSIVDIHGVKIPRASGSIDVPLGEPFVTYALVEALEAYER
jgi:hypothetical protein